MIEAAVRSLLALDYPDYEVVVVDDRSEDATGAILDRLKSGVRRAAGGGARARIARGLAGQDARHVEGRRGGDRRVASVQRCRRGARSRGPAAAPCITPSRSRPRTWCCCRPCRWRASGERMMISFFQAMFIFALTAPGRCATRGREMSMGVGAFNLIRREAYEKIGTYQSMRLSVVDDMRLAEKVKQAGLASRVAFGEGLVTVRWAVGARGVVQQPDQELLRAPALQPGVRACWQRCGLLWLHLGPWLGTAFAAGMGARRLCAGAGLAAGGVCGDGPAHRDRHAATCCCIRWPAC